VLEVVPAQTPAAEQEPFGLLVALIGEVAWRAFGQERREIQRNFLEALNIGILRFLARLDRGYAPLQRLADDPGGMVRLLAELFGGRAIEAALDIAGEEHVREIMRHHPVQGARAVRP